LLLFAVFGLLSACGSFEPYEPGGSFLDFDDKLIYLAARDASEKRTVTVIKSSKQEAFSMEWFFEDEKSEIAKVEVTIEGGGPIDSKPGKYGRTECTVTKTTTYTFTVTPGQDGKTALIIGLYAFPDKPVFRSVEIIVNAVTPYSSSGD
jgi:hypothetical protein